MTRFEMQEEFKVGDQVLVEYPKEELPYMTAWIGPMRDFSSKGVIVCKFNNDRLTPTFKGRYGTDNYVVRYGPFEFGNLVPKKFIRRLA